MQENTHTHTQRGRQSPVKNKEIIQGSEDLALTSTDMRGCLQYITQMIMDLIVADVSSSNLASHPLKALGCQISEEDQRKEVDRIEVE